MKIDFDPADIEALAAPLVLLDTPARRVVAPNRIVYQPMEGNDALPDGNPGPLTFERYRARAAGRAGIDHVEALAVSDAAKARGNQLVIGKSTRDGLARLVEEYRERNDETPLLFQLTHSGRSAATPVTAAPVSDPGARPITDGDLAGIADDVVRAARIAFEVGADGIDFKHCHGYLFGQLLGPANRAREGWTYGGDSMAERARFFTETTARIRDAVPTDRFLLTVRFSAYEGIPGGFGSPDADSIEEDMEYGDLREFCRIMEEAGVRLVNQSSGIPERTPELVRQTNENPLAFFDHQRRAEVVKGTVSVPVVGSGYSYAKSGRNRLPGEPREKNFVTLAGQAIRAGRVDFAGIGRQSLSDPGFATKLLGGGIDEIRWDTSCNKCALSLRSGIPAGCVTWDETYRELFRRVRE